jgi:hypothetical protein
MALAQKTFRIQTVGLALAGLLLSQVFFGLPIEADPRPSAVAPGQTCLLPAARQVSIATPPLLLSTAPAAASADAIAPPPGWTACGAVGEDPVPADPFAPGGLADARPPRSSPWAMPLGAHAPPPLA